MLTYPALEPYGDRYKSIATEPLEIRLWLRADSRLAGYDPLNLDNLLARCVVDEATGGRGLPNTVEAYDLPVPLRCLWRSAEGLPMWAATSFMPDSWTAKDVAYWHKRAQHGYWTGTKNGNFAITSTKGRWMERRVPLPTQIAECWVATCEGNLDEIARLLGSLRYVGKRRSVGFGAVERWTIRRTERPFALIQDSLLTRSLPAMAIELLAGSMPEGQPAPVGWTPPQWKPALFAPGWWLGTSTKALGDFFNNGL